MVASVNPQAWAESVRAIWLFRANREALAVCQRKAASSGAARKVDDQRGAARLTLLILNSSVSFSDRQFRSTKPRH